MSFTVGNPNPSLIIQATQNAVKKDGDMGINVSQKELSNIVENVKSSGVSAEEATRIINDTLAKSGSKQKVNLSTEKLGQTNTFKFNISGKNETTSPNQTTPTKTPTNTTKPEAKQNQEHATPKTGTATNKSTITNKPQPSNNNTVAKKEAYNAEASFSITEEQKPQEKPSTENKIEEKKPQEKPSIENKVEEKKPQEKPSTENKTNELKTTVKHNHDNDHKVLKKHPNHKNFLEKLGDKIEDAFDGKNNHHRPKVHKKHGHVDVSKCPKF
ncbi:MAG: hypothetical protein U0457_20990 [Candidatus Sericytochromatia bacterium]